jgi:hypothetical protein
MTAQLNKASPRTPAQVLAQQKADAEHSRNAAKAAMPATKAPAVPAVADTKTALPAVPDTRTAVQRFFDEVDPVSLVGPRVSFSKDAAYIRHDVEEALNEQTIYAVHADQAIAGVIRFNGPGNPPSTHLGLLYENYMPPPRETLGDTDPSQWEIGLDGKPADPWQATVYLLLEDSQTHELMTFVTTSKTGRRAVAKLLRHYDRMRKSDPASYPLVQLKVGGFQHPDDRVGWVRTPMFAVCGRIPRADVAKPDTSGNHAEFNDEIPFA